MACPEAFNGQPFVDVGAERVTTGTGRTFATETATGADPNGGGEAMAAPRIFVPLDGAQVSLLEKSYGELRQSVYDGLALQTRLKSYLDQVSLTLDEAGIRVDFAGLEAKLDALHAADPQNALIDRIELVNYAGAGLQELGWEGGRAKLAGWDRGRPGGGVVGCPAGGPGGGLPDPQWRG